MTVLLICIATLFPLAGMFGSVVNFSKSRKSMPNAVVFGMACGWGIYGYVCDEGNDIVRHMKNLELYKNIPFYKCFDAIGKITEVYTWDIWSWIMARFNDPYLLSVSAAIVGYGIISYIVFDYANMKRLRVKQYVPMLLVSLTMVSPLDVTNGVRFANAVLICVLAVYKFYAKNAGKMSTFFLFVAAIFLHHATALVVLVWFLMPMIKKHKIETGIGIIVLLLTFTNYESYLSFLGGGTSPLSSILYSSIKSVNTYRATSASFHSLFTRYLQMIFNMAVLLRGASVITDEKGIVKAEKNESAYQSIWLYSTFVFLIGLCMTTVLETNGNRYFIASTLLALVPLMEATSVSGFLKYRKFIFEDGMILACALGCALLYANDMNWGTGSLVSFFISLFGGVFSRVLAF